jgi:hypothetical protein
MKIIKTINLFFLLGVMINCDFHHKEEVLVIPAHSHNDYEHTKPLLEALGRKFKSIEVDVFSVGDSLFLAHDSTQIKPGKTLRKLYLDPLKEIISKNNGSVYGEGTELILLVDIKDDGLRTYKLLHQILENYIGMVTSYKKGIKTSGAISVIVSGNRPFEYMQNQVVRYAGYDGRISDLDSGIASSLMPLVSDNWQNHFKWKGEGEMPTDEKNKLELIVDKCHKNGYMLRFWATPDKPGFERDAVWNKLKKAHVDLIGSDDSKGLQTMFLKQ